MAARLTLDRIVVVVVVVVAAAAFFIVSASRCDRERPPQPTGILHDGPQVTTIATPAPSSPPPRVEPEPVSKPPRVETKPAIARETPAGPRASATPAPTTPDSSPFAQPPAPEPAARRVTGASPAHTRAVEPGLTLEDYFSIMNDEKRPHHQREARIRPYTGVTLTWHGFVREVRTHVDGNPGAGLLAIAVSPERTWDLAICWFDELQGKQLARLRPGDRISVTGSLEPPSGMGPVLRECRLGGPAD